MDVGKLTVEYRTLHGKNESGRLRLTGKVPGICYGKGATPVPVQLDAKALKGALDKEKRRNTVLRLTVTGTPTGSQELTVMLKDYQIDALRNEVTHVDFVTVDITKDVIIEIPMVLTGKAIGTIDGGQLHAGLRRIAVRCKPENIPAKIEVDVTALTIGDALHISDVKLPPGVEAMTASGETVASVVAPKAEKTTTETAADAAATAEAAAAPAAGARPPAQQRPSRPRAETRRSNPARRCGSSSASATPAANTPSNVTTSASWSSTSSPAGAA